MERRDFLAGLCLCCLSGAARAFSFGVDAGAGLLNPCRAPLPEPLLKHDLTEAAFSGLNAGNVWDCHAHLLGSGDSGSGCWISPKMQSMFYPEQFLQRKFFLNAACVDEAAGRIDVDYVSRLTALMNEFPAGYRSMLFAFDHAHAANGTVVTNDTAFHVPNRYAANVAGSRRDRFMWVASIHPYRIDAVQALDEAVREGACAIKWLPSAMGIDPASPLCDPFYVALAKHDLPLISHAGHERAVKGAHRQHFGNPLRLQRALEHGVRVVVAHCASMGRDLDANGKRVESFSLFEQLMADSHYAGRLFGDISALPQTNRAPYLERILKHPEWHGRLLNGSDYPLPGVLPLFSVDELVARGWLGKDAGDHAKHIREYNPLMFDFVIKRHLRINGARFDNSVFETARVFRRPALTTST
ncbi:MAG: amidohydrolase family protein [Betaproteobacteria bacterium]